MTEETTLKSDIVIAGVNELNALTPLFDAYRVFYGQASNIPAANHFLFERIINHESVIFLSRQDGSPTGFVQLYPSFSSVALDSLWILNDLYVAPEYRCKGVGRQLIQKAIDLVKERGDRGLLLETAKNNTPAKTLYESMTFKCDNAFDHYELILNQAK